MQVDCNRMQQVFEILQAARADGARLVGAYKVEVGFVDSIDAIRFNRILDGAWNRGTSGEMNDVIRSPADSLNGSEVCNARLMKFDLRSDIGKVLRFARRKVVQNYHFLNLSEYDGIRLQYQFQRD